jgi:uncharacterized protein
MIFEKWIQTGLPVSERSIQAVLELKAEGATVPFMARYRKEKTGNLDEVQIQKIIELKEEWDEVLNRQGYIVSEIEKQGKLTDDLKKQILGTFDKNLLEDLYLPFKQKRKSKATLAKEAGLEPLSQWIWDVAHGTVQPEPGQTLTIWAFTFKNEEKGFKDAEAAIQGATDILIERLSENLALRQFVRETFQKRACIKTTKAEKSKPNSKYQNYFEYEEKVSSLLEPRSSHRYLAIRRGWIEEEISIQFGGSKGDETFDSDLSDRFRQEAAVNEAAKGNSEEAIVSTLEKAARIALKAHVLPSIENEFHKQLKDSADQVGIQVFSENVRKVLLAPPYGPKGVLGVDPGLRTGCKLAVIDGSGKYLTNTVMRLNTDSEKEQAKSFLKAVCESGQIMAIAVGNGTAGRETETFIRQALKENNLSLPVVMVSEAGASVYSASAIAREEFPDLDITVRGAISIARRFQDPLAELVKIDPKSIGVGQYQHDVSQNGLKRALEAVVDSSVNAVGVNLNTGSAYVLAHVSGIGDSLAKSIVEYREKNGLFKTREDLLSVPRFSKKTFEQAAGFLRVFESENPLDRTGVHPEKYSDLEALAKDHGKSIQDWMGAGAKSLLKIPNVKEKLGEFTYQDIVLELEKPGRDPRDTFVPIQFRDDINSLKDVQSGMICPGVVTNVTNFGAFVDIGVHQDGLVHISQLGQKFVTDPNQVVSPGMKVTVRVLEVNVEKSQMSLTMRMDQQADQRANQGHAEKSAGQNKDRSGVTARKKQKNSPTPAAPVEPKKLVVSYQGATATHQASQPQVSSNGPRIQQPSTNTSRPQQNRPQYNDRNQAAAKPKPQVAFNNAFAGLAALKDAMKDAKK